MDICGLHIFQTGFCLRMSEVHGLVGRHEQLTHEQTCTTYQPILHMSKTHTDIQNLHIKMDFNICR